MADKAIVNGVISPEEVRKQIVAGLNIGHLTVAEQDTIIGDLGAALMERATMALMMQVPEKDFDAIDALTDMEGKEAEMVSAIQKAVPNAAQIIEDAIRSGVEEYKILVNEQVKMRLEAEEAQK